MNGIGVHISEPEFLSNETSVTLRARVVCPQRVGTPDWLWFRFPVAMEPLLERGVEPFVVALSSLAAAANLPLEVDGPLGERLHAGLTEYWAVFHQWKPQDYQPLKLRCGGLRPESPPGESAATAFSGGVDSFFTLFRHLASQEPRPSFRLKYALFVHGFDIPLANERTYHIAADAYERALDDLGVVLIRAATNVRQFVRRWEYSHGTVLCGTARVLSKGVRRFYVPSSKSYSTLEPWGSDPLLDPLLSSDSFQVIHDGAASTRFDKLYDLKDWPVIRPLLRTCWSRPDGLHNCGQCTNCRRTMAVLASLGVLDLFPTFPQGRTDEVFATEWKTPHERLFGRQAIEWAARRGDHELARSGRQALGDDPIPSQAPPLTPDSPAAT
jgi:hypothetical protein